MILQFCYNVKKEDVYLKALKHHAKNNPKTYVFKDAFSLDGEHLPDMEGVYQYRSQKDLETYEPYKVYQNKKQNIINNYLKKQL